MNKAEEHPERLRVRVEDRYGLDLQLNEAESNLRRLADAYGDRGILVTRHSPWDFTIELHPDVPFGTSREQHDW